jgi:hypothetical protein
MNRKNIYRIAVQIFLHGHATNNDMKKSIDKRNNKKKKKDQ